jgi:hypothetical protein
MTDTDHPELVEFEGETLGDTLTNLLTEVKELRRQIKVAQGVFEYLYHFHGADKSEDAHWIRWFCNMESEEE